MQRDRRSTTPTERGYGTAHHKERARVDRIVQAGEAACCRCGSLIEPGSDWHLDHTDDRSGYLGPSHPDCNVRAANGRGRGFTARLAEQRRWSREWLPGGPSQW
jgi:hypothetical protein